MKTQSVYETKDLYEAAFLIVMGFTLIQTYTQKVNENKVVFFVFSDKDSCFDYVKAYLNYQGEVSPKKYTDAIKSLKDIVHASKRQ